MIENVAAGRTGSVKKIGEGPETRALFLKPHSGIPAPGIPSDWFILTVYINTLSAS